MIESKESMGRSRVLKFQRKEMTVARVGLGIGLGGFHSYPKALSTNSPGMPWADFLAHLEYSSRSS